MTTLTNRPAAYVIVCLAPYHVPASITRVIRGSVGAALEVANRVGGVLGTALEHAARSAFVSGMHLGLTAGAAVAVVGALGRSPSCRACRGPGGWRQVSARNCR